MNTFLRKIINLKDVVIFYYTSFFYTISLCLRHILLNTYYCNKKHLHIYPQQQGVQQQLQQQQQVLQVFRFTQSRTRRVRVVSVVVRAGVGGAAAPPTKFTLFNAVKNPLSKSIGLMMLYSTKGFSIKDANHVTRSNVSSDKDYSILQGLGFDPKVINVHREIANKPVEWNYGR